MDNVWELSAMECKDLSLWLEDAKRAHVAIDEEGFKIKLDNGHLVMWSRGLGKKWE